MHIVVTDTEGKEHNLPAVEEWSVMEIIRDYGLPIKAECGGACLCGTCHVYVHPDWVDKLYPKTDDEEDRLMEDALALARRLAELPGHGALQARQALQAAYTNSLNVQLHLEAERQRELLALPSFEEGVQAFLDKREPRFRSA